MPKNPPRTRPQKVAELVESMSQLNIRVPESAVRASKRLAAKNGQTLSQFVLDLMLEAIAADVETLKQSIDEAAQRAEKEIEMDRAVVASIERQNEDRLARHSAATGEPVVHEAENIAEPDNQAVSDQPRPAMSAFT